MRNKITLLIIVLLLNNLINGQNWLQGRIISEQFEKAVEHFDNNRYATADNILRKIINKPSGNFELPSKILLLKTGLALGKLDEVTLLVKELIHEHGNHEYLMDTYMVLGDVFIEKRNIDGALRMYLQSRKLATNSLFLKRLDGRIMQTMKLSLMEQSILDLQLLAIGENEIILGLALASHKLQKGESDNSAYVLSQINPLNVPENYLDYYEQLQLASYEPEKETVEVGVILPLSGENSELGKSFLRGLYQPLSIDALQTNFIYEIEDNHSNYFETIHAVKRLKQNKNILCIIAIINDEAALASANLLDDTLIPLLIQGGSRISHSTENKHVFQMITNWAEQGRLSARWIGDVMAKDSVAILSPTDDFGQIITDAFLKEMNALDRTVVAVERYAGKPDNLKQQFQTLRDKAFSLIQPDNPYDEFLGMSLDSLDALFNVDTDEYFNFTEEDEDVNEIKDSSDVILSSIQALYIPIQPEYVKYIATQFPIYNLQTHLVGNNHWYQPHILDEDHIAPHIEGLTILSHKYNSIRRDYLDDSFRDDDLFYLGYDICKMLIELAEGEAYNHLSFMKNLENINYEGEKYSFSFSPKNHQNTAMRVLKYHNRKFESIGMFVDDSVQIYTTQRP